MKESLGKLQPQATDLEEAIIGAMLIDKNSIYAATGILSSEMFYKNANRIIFDAIQSLDRQVSPVDLLTVTQYLMKSKQLESIGGPFYLTEITSRIVSAANIEYHARIVQQKFIERETIRICTETLQRAYNDSGDIFQSIDDLQVGLLKLVSQNTGNDATIISSIIQDRIRDYQVECPDGLTGITSGFPSIDKLTAGWQKSDLTIIAARPGMGKTAFMLALVRNAAVSSKKSTLIFSLEMSKEQLTDRLISAETTIRLDYIRKRQISDQDLQKIMTIHDLIDSKILIDDSAAISTSALRSKCIKLKQTHDIGMIAIDYLQLMKGERENNGNREQEISSISRCLKALAKELNVPVLALSQLSRKSEERPNKTPLLSDLRESGSIEQDADQVVFLFRPEYYGILQDSDGNSTFGVTDVIFAKNRHGALDTVNLSFNGAFMKFTELEEAAAF